MIRLVAIAALVWLGVFLAPREALAQPGARTTHRVGVLSFGRAADEAAQGPVQLRRWLERMGWALDRNLVLEPRFAEGSAERLGQFAGELVRRQVDAIYADGPEAAEAAARATRTTPIVFWGHAFPVEAGLVESLGKPGGNVTGVTPWTGPELGGKLLELLNEIAPRMNRLAFVTGPFIAPERPAAVATRSLRHAMPSIEQAGSRLGVEVRMLRLDGRGEPDEVLDRIQAWRADAIVVGGDQTTRQHCRRIVEFANKNRIPAAFAFKECMDAGGLIAYADDVPEAIRRSAVQLDRILRGARPADLPVEQPTRFELVVNLRTAKTLGLTVPQSILVRADRVIE